MTLIHCLDYFTIRFSGEKIWSCNLGGGDLATLVPDGLEAPDAIAVIGDNLYSIKPLEVQNVFLNISPNPLSNSIIIGSSSALKEIIIYSHLGEIIDRHQVRDINIVFHIS